MEIIAVCFDSYPKQMHSVSRIHDF